MKLQLVVILFSLSLSSCAFFRGMASGKCQNQCRQQNMDGAAMNDCLRSCDRN